MSDLMNEVDEDLRRQRMVEFWRENQNWIIGGILLAIIATGGMAWWRGYSYKHDMAATGQMMQVVDKGDVKALQDYAAGADKDHAVIAQLTAAGIHLQRGEKDQALAIFDKIAATRGLDSSLRDLARLYALQQRLSDVAPAQLHAQLSPLMKDDNQWRFTAREMDALVFAREGRMKEAADDLALISGDAEAPQAARTRAFTLHELYEGNAQGLAAAARPDTAKAAPEKSTTEKAATEKAATEKAASGKTDDKNGGAAGAEAQKGGTP